ncbi:MAG TPA: class I SAM-dependent methyltransferase [Bacteroidales bacterium]|nr:class I SAM-dependent methyltransferase [Bacteroidales bacterium]HRZ48714.1 class I SAM-dependent methyltransferase [Bacteroidales bacterium]
MNSVQKFISRLFFNVSADRSGNAFPPELQKALKKSPHAGERCDEAILRVRGLRSALMKDHTEITVNDLGAGPGERLVSKRKISNIARKSTQPEKYSRLQYRLMQLTRPSTVLELGTSLGLTTALLSMAHPEARIITIEGCENTARLAQKNFSTLGVSDAVVQVTGPFEEVLDGVLSLYHPIDYIFFDGNHRMAPTLNYFLKSLNHISDKAVMVFDDIRWSDQMESAWDEILKHPRIRCSVDLFGMGILFFDQTMPEGRHKIRY